ncbi:MAG TPA: YhcH/YjgK/YiaL family protein, partial [Mucilaginibacter sp.]|nr:YhcH/YjgK/YiaL family protein [Mucilaginibacter sp.]
SRRWAGDSKLKLKSSTNYLEFAKQYQANKQYWDQAFAFLNDSKLDTLKPGKYVIDGENVYATITDAPSKTFEQSAWESHRNYIDLQYVIRGKEKIGVAPVTSATVIKPYDAGRDAANYNADGQFYIAAPGEFFLFFPGDAHRPNIKVDGYDTVKKLVIKIRYTTVSPQ